MESDRSTMVLDMHKMLSARLRWLIFVVAMINGRVLVIMKDLIQLVLYLYFSSP